MIWLFWRRWRLTIMATGVAVGALGALVVLAGALTGGAAEPARQSESTSAVQLPGPKSPTADATKVRRGELLMAAAAMACRAVTYHGVQMVAWWGSGGSSAYLIAISHRAGSPNLERGDNDADDRSRAGQATRSNAIVGLPSAAASGHAASGVLTVSLPMLSLMRANYLIEYAGSGSASGRPAAIVSLRRPDGTLAAQYWLDRNTGLPLRRQMFAPGGRMVNEGAFIDLKIGQIDPTDVPAPGARAWNAEPSVLALARMRGRGWSVPAALPGNLALVSVTRTTTRSGPVLDASYSDGLSVVSVFVQRGELAGSLAGWQVADVHGVAVYSSAPDDRSLAWSASGFVYTVIADAPQDTVERIVAALPHDRGIGFWARVGRGLERMGSWFDPFG